MPWKNGNPPLYSVWRSMLGRCYNRNVKQYKDYGGRGIKVCASWKRSFNRFVKDMGPRPTPQHTLDRKNNDGNYERSNCQWATRKEQQRNQTVTRRVIIEGIEYVAADLADIAEIKTDYIIDRVKRGLSYEEVISKGRKFNLDGLKLGAKVSASKRNKKRRCKRGHLYTLENTRIETNGKYSWRVCRACDNMNTIERNAAIKRHLNSQLQED